jgi:hypothetical protein
MLSGHSSDVLGVGPHATVASSSPKERLVAALLDDLWFQYNHKVPFAAQCQDLLSSNELNNDHVAFRTLGGIHRVARIFEALGYEARGCYTFPDKHLTAIHYEHTTNPKLPKIFISELKTYELPQEARDIIQDVVMSSHRPDLSNEFLAQLHEAPSAELLSTLVDHFETLPWKKLPSKSQVETLNQFSQYAAWVLVHGYKVNHFTLLVQPPDNIEIVYEKMRAAGIPVKPTIEGLAGSKLRQTSTQAVMEDVAVVGDDDGLATTMPWPYAYVELAERPVQKDGTVFDGFMTNQALQLFEMTKRQQECPNE